MSEPPKPKPLALYRAHRILIGAGIFCALVLTFYEARMYRHTGVASSLVVAIVGMTVAIGLLAYLRYFNRKIARS
jgi:hypothetical protein